MPAAITVLGPQRPTPNLPEALQAAGVASDGMVVAITAGWRLNEVTDAGPLERAVGRPIHVLPLYHWFDHTMQRHPDIAQAYTGRQARVRALKDLYRVRVRAASSVVEALLGRLDADPDLVGPELGRAVMALRRIDDEMLARVREIKASVPEVAEPWTIPGVRERHERAKEIIDNAAAVVLAGGHVAVLRNRMLFFGLEVLLQRALSAGIPIFAWSAGAMVLTERIVLFYDDPPAGPPDPEVLEAGLGLLPGVVLLPHARLRLRLDDRRHMANLALRFAPWACVTLENGAWLDAACSINRGAQATASRIGLDGGGEALR